MYKFLMVAVTLLALLCAPAALAQDKGERQKGPDLKSKQDGKAEEIKAGDGKKDPSLLAKTIAKVMTGFGGMMKEPNPVKNLPRMKSIMDSVFEAVVRMSVRKMDADLKVLLEAYISIVRDVGPAHFSRVQAVARQYKSQKKLAAKEGLELYKGFVRYRTWMNKYYNDGGCSPELKPTVKKAIAETDKLISRFLKWMLTLPGINKGKLKGAAEDAMDKFGKAINQGGGAGVLQDALKNGIK